MVLDSVTAEVSLKVKNAIKAKLNELGVYVDDELPDYIMILVGNRKTKDQMDDDLSLFLGHNTERFTSWLHDVLQRLNAASINQKETIKPVKEKKKEEEEEIVPEPEEVVKEEKKKHKKKKDKSEKKKEKKEKKKKKDKEKHSKSKRKEEKAKSKSKSPLDVKTTPTLVNIQQSSTSSEALLKASTKTDDSVSNGSKITSTSEEVNVEKLKTPILIKDDDLPSDVVNLRPNAEDLALGLEDEPPTKKIKTKLVTKEIKDKDSDIPEILPQTITSIEIQVDNPRAKESLSRASSDDSTSEVSTSNVHERLGPKRVINLREESTFPSKSSGVEGIGRVVSSAIASAVKSVTLGNKSDGKSGKRLEARVRPLISSRIKQPEEEEEEEVDDVALPPARLVSTVGAVLKRSHSDDSDNDEPPSKRVIGVASKVEVTPRPRRPGALQANTALILRAVADAHKSVNKPSRKSAQEKEEERVRKEIFSRSYQERQNQRLTGSVEGKPAKKFAITVPNAVLNDTVDMKIAGKPSLEKTYADEIEMDEMPAPGKEEMRIKSKILPQPKIIATNKVVPMQVDESGSTRFIVTLDGFGNEVTSTDLRSRIRGRPVRTPSVDEEEFIEEVEEWEEEVEEMEGVTPPVGVGPDNRGTSAVGAVAPKWKAKIDASDLVTKKEEWCKFWPACKEGLACQFIHPSKTCNTFPNCRFGDKCFYVHPKCKFDSSCTKSNCPFSHTVPRSGLGLGLGNPGLKSKISNPIAMIKCRYYPKCVDMNCPYMHPKQICRYGKSCQTPSCMFVHPDVTTGSLLKWKAPKPADKSNLSAAAVSVPSAVVSKTSTAAV